MILNTILELILITFVFILLFNEQKIAEFEEKQKEKIKNYFKKRGL